jgi:hypothetical protein
VPTAIERDLLFAPGCFSGPSGRSPFVHIQIQSDLCFMSWPVTSPAAL